MNPNLNQALHMIVAKSWKGVKNDDYDVKAGLTTAGDVCFIVNPDTKQGRFVFRDNDTIKSSPLLSKADIFSVLDAYRTSPNGANGTVLTKYHKKVSALSFKDTVPDTIDSTDVATINLSIKNYLVIGDENTYLKQGFCQLTPTITKPQILVTLAKSLVDNLRRDEGLGIEVCVGSVSSAGAVTTKISFDQLKTLKLSELLKLTGVTKTMSVVISESQAEWELGKYNFERPQFDVHYGTIEWGTISKVADYEWADIDNYQIENAGVVNGYAYADLEYFCQAMRGNMLRKKYFPYSNFTQPLIDPTCEYESVVFDYHYEGDAEDVQHSPAQLYVVALKGNLTAIVTAIETALGLKSAPAQSGGGN